MHSVVAKMYSKSEFSVFEIMKKEKNCASFAVNLKLQMSELQCLVSASLRWRRHPALS